MIGAVFLAVLAGRISTMAVPTVERWLDGLFLARMELLPTQSLALSFVVCLLGATILAMILSLETPAFVVLLGGGIGLFGKQIFHAVKGRVL